MFIVALLCILNKGAPPPGGSGAALQPAHKPTPVTPPPDTSHRSLSNDIEFVDSHHHSPNDDGGGHKMEDAYELLGNFDVEQAYDLGFGTGPGLYGSGRHYFDMMEVL